MKVYALTATAVLGVAAACHGAPVVFDNSGMQFPWLPSFPQSGQIRDRLDITQPETQSGGPTDLGLLYMSVSPTTSSMIVTHTIDSAGASVRIAQDQSLTQYTAPSGQTHAMLLASTFAPGSTVGPSVPSFQHSAGVSAFCFQCGHVPMLGQRAYIGVQLSLPTGAHYGWVELEWGPDSQFNLNRYSAVRWAYETDAGVAIAIPGGCAADLDGDGQVGSSDLASLLGAWSQAGPADLDGDGFVGSSDLAALLGGWGPC